MGFWIFFLLLPVIILAQDFNSSCYLLNDPVVSSEAPVSVKNYKVRFKTCQNTNWITLREFDNKGVFYNVILNTITLDTEIIKASCLSCQDMALTDLAPSPYKRLLDLSKDHSHPLSNAGINRIEGEKGVFLTVDLCPSQREFDYRIFDNIHIQQRKNFPVAVAISGGWIKYHQDSLNWLKRKQWNHDLDIVWVNHSYTHPYKKGVPNKDNFLLTPGDSLDAEIFNQEKYMIASGIKPSIFFRFPGLISSPGLVTELANYGLLTLGSDAWLALGQRPRAGSIILIHGNGNEELGVHLFLNLLDQIKDLQIFKSLVFKI